MTRNGFQDNTGLPAAQLNALLNGPAQEGVISGCDPIKGGGTWDVDVSSGSIYIGNPPEQPVASQTVDLADPTSDMNIGETRVVLVTLDNSGTASFTEGASATDPASPDIPSGEVCVAVVVVAEADTGILDTDLYDARTMVVNPVRFPFDISVFAVYQNISTQEFFPRGIAWNNDGSKLYEVDSSSDSIYEYDVFVPFDIGTATFSQSISTETGNPTGIAWNNDGSKLYEVGSVVDLIYESDVSTPFDISTASSVQSISTQDASPTGITWNNDGSKLYEIGRDSSLIYESNVSTPFDIGTATFSQSINTQSAGPRGMAWNDEGTKLYEVTDNSVIYEYVK